MPRRLEPDPLALAIGRRVQALRMAAGLTREKLVHEAGTSSSGHLSDLERGLVIPNVATLQAFADRLGVLLVDVVAEPTRSDRERLLELTRDLSPTALRRLIRDIERARKPAKPSPGT